ncbi:hypothetical protein WICPIJ_005128 [Wickerhamomyces pijperi]|uniref:VPS4-associated protein 1 n=1 Tax=Wickerhamomyces pijperi TaxID=599730 RepID=A0A9P8TLF6_WICPI|nr:hypothetical protein WICPIJ_005128 [Wickerhamomyces pijperi]
MSFEPFKNVYNLRAVAEASRKPCDFCFKPTTAVLITSDGSSDFFYTCETHLRDSSFATPIYSEEYKKALEGKTALEGEIKFLKQKWEEKHRYGNWEKIMSYASWGSKDNKIECQDGGKNGKKDKADEPPKDPEAKKLDDLTTKSNDYDTVLNQKQKVYELNKDIFKIRLDKKFKKFIQAKAANPVNPTDTTTSVTRNANVNSDYTNIKDASMFPSVPKNTIK